VWVITTEQGNQVQVVRDKYGLAAAEGLAGWGLVVDLNHVELIEHVNYPFAWRQDIGAQTQHLRQDELIYSFSLKLKHPETMGLIIGAGRGIYSSV